MCKGEAKWEVGEAEISFLLLSYKSLRSKIIVKSQICLIRVKIFRSGSGTARREIKAIGRVGGSLGRRRTEGFNCIIQPASKPRPREAHLTSKSTAQEKAG